MFLFVFAGSVFFVNSASAATITAAKAGAWSSSSTWIGGVLPSNSDTVDCGAYIVTIDEDLTGSLAPAAISASNSTGNFYVSTNTIIGDSTHNLVILYSGTNAAGLIRVATGTLTINGSVTNTGVGSAIAVSNAASLTIFNGTNTAIDENSGTGKAVSWTSTGTLNITGNIINSTGTGSGWGIYIATAPASATITGNVNYGGTSTSGLIRVTAGTLMVNGLVTNTGDGYAIYVTGGGSLTIYNGINTVINENTGAGRAVSWTSTGTLNITGNIINSTGTGSGYGLLMNTAPASATITGNVNYGGTSLGGLIAVSAGSLTINGSVTNTNIGYAVKTSTNSAIAITGAISNTGTGRAIYYISTSTTSTVVGNISAGQGYGLYATAGLVTITGSLTSTGSGVAAYGTGYYTVLITSAAITGTAQVSNTLIANLTPSGANANYQWLESSAPTGTYTSISGAASSTYTPVTGDLGMYIKVMATGIGDYSGIQTSSHTIAVTSAPTINITSFDLISDISAGTAGSTTYQTAEEVTAALPRTVMANCSAVTIPVSTWTDTSIYNSFIPGTYVFTAVLGTIPSGFTNSSSLTATAKVMLAVSSGEIIPTCTSFTYSNWSVCSGSGTQVRTVATSSPTGCQGGSGNPILYQSCSLSKTSGLKGTYTKDFNLKIYATAGKNTELMPLNDQAASNLKWMAEHTDLANTSTSFYNLGDKTLEYFNWADLQQSSEGYRKLYEASVQNNANFDDVFLHYVQDQRINISNFTLSNYSSQKEDKFYKILYNYTDITNNAYGDISTGYRYNLPICQNANDSIYIGFNWEFKEINFNLAIPATVNLFTDTNPEAQLLYSDGSAWQNLIVSDGTSGMTKSGKITFIPPANWAKNTVGNNTLYWVRLQCLSALGSNAPIAQSNATDVDQYGWQGVSAISGEKYQTVSDNGNTYIIVPGYPNGSATFEWQSRAPSKYFTGRWPMNYRSTFFSNFVNSETASLSNGADGIFLDNTDAMPQDYRGSGLTTTRFLEYQTPLWLSIDPTNTTNSFTQDLMIFLTSLKQAIGKIIIINAGSGGYSLTNLINSVNGFLLEGRINYNSRSSNKSPTVKYIYDYVDAFCNGNTSKYAIFSADPSYCPGSSIDPGGTCSVNFPLYALARYYMTYSSCTYFQYQTGTGSSALAQPWNDWFNAIEYDLGSPSIAANQTTDEFYKILPGNITTLYGEVLARNFTNGIVLLRSDNLTDAPVNVSLESSYCVLNKDGTIGTTPTNMVTLSGFEGKIMVNCPKTITAFNFEGLSPAVMGVVAKSSHTITLTIPYGTDITSLVPTIAISGVSISPASGVIEDFTNPVIYTVTAADTTTQNYTVIVTLAPGSSSPFIPPTKPNITNINITVLDNGTTTFNLPSNITQIAISRTPDFANVSWQDFNQDKFSYINETQETLYLKFRTNEGAVSDTIIITPQSSINNPISLIDGDIIQCKSSNDPNAVYIVKITGTKTYIRHIASIQIFNYYKHLKWENLKQVNSLTPFSLSSWIRVNTNTNGLPKAEDKVYEINGDQTKHWINMTSNQFLTHGGSDEAIYTVNTGELNLYSAGADVMSL